MMRKLTTMLVLACATLLVGCFHAKVQNPLAKVDSKQPDKTLFDNAMTSMKQGKYETARTLLETLINAYPDSEYIARAKMAVGDSWLAEGGNAAMLQAEREFKDFATFFPNMPEAAEAQLKIADIHYKQMEKSDRDFTQAVRAAEEYRLLLQQYPDSPLAPKARQRLRNVQEVLAQHQFGIAHFYYLRDNMAAAQARMQSLIDSYPLYSEMGEALFLMGTIYERQATALRSQNTTSAKIVADSLDKKAIESYSKIVTRYPAMSRTNDAKRRLADLKAPIPTPTPEALAQSQAEEKSRVYPGRVQRMLGGMKKHPDVSRSSKVGEPNLQEETQASAPAIIRDLQTEMNTVAAAQAPAPAPARAPASTSLSMEPVSAGKGTAPGANEATPGRENAPTGGEGAAAAPAPRQINEIQPPSGDAAKAGQDTPTSGSDKQDSSSKKKGKKGLRKLIPF
ncbi:MAG TPA: outer membrane protein assembly factor BamD [Alphaproteobacteria bacterium]|nr:outer membrane protein assembly factor BamD [Alphaproteobacteria bacterium]